MTTWRFDEPRRHEEHEGLIKIFFDQAFVASCLRGLASRDLDADEAHLALRRGGEGDGVFAGETGVAVARRVAVRAADRLEHAVEREVAEGVGGDVARDLFGRVARR